ncbi:PTPA-CTERM sorting domain-containing protein [Nodosilinea sp. E11]|uniref:PTPA-CTERM sorting domain-containing protein n=1 Tax=Nodosilinea sp. E11 TaxID=3037479 RepID=UPI0029342480|nr:PTPA-CTERM sorting domain-containing protein [Nodosilinea sp. E11]WOD39257.1 PTPA-CTERM sorting domain-containing protein [Nodosilinea sp. E11]
MNLKTYAPLAAIVGVIAAEVVVVSPVQAASLTPGAFQLSATSPQATNLTGLTPNSFTLQFNEAFFNLNTGTSAPTGGFIGLTEGTLSITDLTFDRSSLTITNPSGAGGYINFISGLFLSGEEVFVDILASSEFIGTMVSPTNYTLAGLLEGRVRSASSTIIATGSLFSLEIGRSSTDSIGIVTVPTPALLPGLLAMGVAALRQRKQETESTQETEVEV